MTGHFISAVCRDGVSGYFSFNKDIIFIEVCLGRVTCAGRFLAIETMALHHHLGLPNNSQCDCTATTAAFSEGWVIHVGFSSCLFYVLGADFAER